MSLSALPFSLSVLSFALLSCFQPHFPASYRLFATVGELDGVGALDSIAVGVFIVAEVGAGVVVLHLVSEVVGHFLWLRGERGGVREDDERDNGKQ